MVANFPTFLTLALLRGRYANLSRPPEAALVFENSCHLGVRFR